MWQHGFSAWAHTSSCRAKCFVRGKKRHHALQVASELGKVSALQSIELLCGAIQCVLNETAWAWTFAQCGLCARQRELSTRLRTHLQGDHEGPLPSAGLETLQELQAVWIRGR